MCIQWVNICVKQVNNQNRVFFLSTILINYKLKYLTVRGKNSQVKMLGHSTEPTLMLLNIFLYLTLF